MATKKTSSESKKAARAAKSSRKPASPYEAIKSAVRIAWAGDVAASRPVLEDLAKQGNVPACAALAVILAFEGELAAMIPLAGTVIRQNLTVSTGNVDTEMTKLLLRAGHVTGKWKEIAGALPDSRTHLVIDHVRAQAAASGTLSDPTFTPKAEQPEELRRRYFADAMEGAPKMPRYKKSPEELPVYAYTMAAGYFLDDEIIARFPLAEPKLRLQSVLPFVKALIRAGRADEAWKTIQKHLATWSAVDYAQVAPVELLVDQELRTLMTPERCKEVLATPRAIHNR